MIELSNVPVDALLEEALRRRDEMVDDKGFLSNGAFGVADHLSTRVCVDGVPVRRNEEGDIELMAIERQTGPYAGKLALIGGGVGRIKENGMWVPESVEEAMGRHFMTDLGQKVEPVVSWEHPQLLAQDMRPIDGEVREGFMPNPASRHLIAARYLVKITEGEDNPVFGSGAGGQEASGVRWFTQDQMPAADAFGYNHGHTYQSMFPLAENLVARS